MKGTSPFGNGLEQAAAASIRSGARSVQEPSGAAGAGALNTSGLADTFGSLTPINAARGRWGREERAQMCRTARRFLARSPNEWSWVSTRAWRTIAHPAIGITWP